jgi:hypothetical protein
MYLMQLQQNPRQAETGREFQRKRERIGSPLEEQEQTITTPVLVLLGLKGNQQNVWSPDIRIVDTAPRDRNGGVNV